MLGFLGITISFYVSFEINNGSSLKLKYFPGSNDETVVWSTACPTSDYLVRESR